MKKKTVEEYKTIDESLSDLPDKIYFKIGEVAKIIGVDTHILRYWENKFSQLKPYKTKTKQRLYKKSDIALLKQIKQLRYDQKLTMEGSKDFLSDDKNGNENKLSASSKQTIVDEKFEESIDNAITELKDLIQHVNQY